MKTLLTAVGIAVGALIVPPLWIRYQDNHGMSVDPILGYATPAIVAATIFGALGWWVGFVMDKSK